MKYDIFLFDADDTLFDFYHTGQKCFIKAFSDIGITASENDYDVYSEINQKRWDLFSLGKIDKQEVVIGRFEEYSAVKGISFDVYKIYELYENNLAKTCILLPDTREVLSKLKSEGKRIFLITNGLKAVQRGRLAVSDISDYFEDVFISDEIGYKKPSEEYFDYVSSHIKDFDKKKTLIVGDSLVADIMLGINNNVDTCHFCKNILPYSGNAKPTYSIDKLTDIFKICEQ